MPRTTIRSEDITDAQVKTADMSVDPTNASNLSSGSVPLAQLGNAPETDTTVIEDDIALLGFKVAVNGSLAKYNLVDQTEDAFMDATGIDASASTNEVRAAANYYSGNFGTDPTGGTITTYSSGGTDYKVHTYLLAQTGTNFVNGGPGALPVDYLIVGGGGGGGGGNRSSGATADAGSGAGGGAFYTAAAVSLAAATYLVTVGAGGAAGVGQNTPGSDGGNSVFNSITANGGGNGVGPNTDGGTSGNASGGGAGGGGAVQSGGAGGAYGNPGGAGPNVNPYAGAGGGGGGAVGEVPTTTKGGDGGVGGVNVYFDGTNNYYAGGGGGGAGGASSTKGLGNPNGGGGDGGQDATDGTAATANTGGGGGGASSESTNGGAGGSGIVVIRYDSSLVGILDMTLVSNSTTAEAAPTKGDIVMTYTNGAGTATLNTDLTAEFSADNGSTWTSTTLVDQGTTGTHEIVSAHNVTLTSTSGTAMKYRIKTLNQGAAKETRIQAVSLGWS